MPTPKKVKKAKKVAKKKKAVKPKAPAPDPVIKPLPNPSPVPPPRKPAVGLVVGGAFRWQGRMWSVLAVGEENVVAMTTDEGPGLQQKIAKSEVE